MGIFSDSIKIKWNHFGYKLSITLSKKALNSTDDLYKILMKKIYSECPKFHGLIAHFDENNAQKFINCDLDLRKAIEEMKGGNLKIHTALPERSSLPVAEKPVNKFQRSYSVPPMNAQVPTSSKNAPKASISFEPKTKPSNEPRPSIQNSLHSRYDRKNSGAFSRTRSSIRSGTSSGSHSSMIYPSTAHYPLGYHQSYSSYNNAPCGPAHYGGMPPFNMLLGHLLTGGHYHPMHPAYAAGAFMGPNRYMGGFAW